MSKKVLSVLSVLLVLGMLVAAFAGREEAKGNQKEDTQELKNNKNKIKNKTKKNEKKVGSKTDLPDVKRTDWNLQLVNDAHPAKTDKMELKELNNGYFIDDRVCDSYYKMADAAEQAGIMLTIISAYRSIEEQQVLYDADIAKHAGDGCSPEEAKKKTEEYLTFPGTSEHHTGMAIDVVDQPWFDAGNGLEESFCETLAAKWLAENAANYGFIIRYLDGKEAVTKINYEPWHLRYVGIENAQYIMEHQIVLEEYLEI